MTQEEVEKIGKMSLKLEEMESGLKAHFEQVRLASRVLSLWREWVKIHGYSDHAKGLIEQTNQLIGE